MGACDLQPVRLEVVGQHLAEAAFLAHRLLGAGRRRTGAGIVILVFGRRRRGHLVAVILVFGRRRRGHLVAVILAGGGGGPAAAGGAFDQAFVEMEIAVVADRDDAAGAGSVLLGI